MSVQGELPLQTELKPTTIIYHDDHDGECSAVVAIRSIQGNWDLPHPHIHLHRINYGQPLPDDEYLRGRKVYMLDFAASMKAMRHIQDLAEMFVWIDHHRTSLEAALLEGFSTYGIRKEGAAGCELTWDYFCSPTPRAPTVDMVGRWDVWDWQDRPGYKQFHIGLEGLETDPEKEEGWDNWRRLFVGQVWKNLQEVTDNGRAIERYLQQRDKQLCQKVYLTTLRVPGRPEEYLVGALNTQAPSSEVYQSILLQLREAEVAMFVFWSWKDGKWVVSLRRDGLSTVDVSEIAAGFGGGGHPGAAGFTCGAGKLPLSLLRGEKI